MDGQTDKRMSEENIYILEYIHEQTDRDNVTQETFR